MQGTRQVDTRNYRKVGQRTFQSIPVGTLFVIPTWGFYTRIVKENGYNAAGKVENGSHAHMTSVPMHATVIEYKEREDGIEWEIF